MNRFVRVTVLVAALIALAQTQGLSKTIESSGVAAKYRWKLEDLYPSDQAWNKAKEQLAAQFDEVLSYKGKLSGSAGDLRACLDFNSRLSKDFGRLHSYAAMRSDADTRNSECLAMRQQVEQLVTNYNSKASFIEPEIVEMDVEKIEAFIAADPGLKPYTMYLHDIQRMKRHTLSEKEERILAEASLLAASPASINFVFSNAELPFAEIELSDGATARLNQAGYARYRALPNRSDREAVFEAFWGTFNKFRQTFGVQLYGNVKRHMFYARTRGYKSSLDRALDRNNIPTEVYMALVANVNRNLDSFGRYLRLKKRMLGVDVLKYSDLYAPVVEDIDLEYTFDEAKSIVLDALTPLGADYVRTVEKAFNERWIDVYPSEGKRMGAYSNGSAYDVHPYILLNYNDKYDDVSTLAHELGHAMHSYYSNRTQPYPTADYATFVAEVASTFNQALLINKMLEQIKDDNTRLSLLMNYLEGIRLTVFRQTQFAEFELRIHEKAEAGQPLTGDVLTELYDAIVKKYYGHADGTRNTTATPTEYVTSMICIRLNGRIFRISITTSMSTSIRHPLPHLRPWPKRC
jgi:oligoendopeptidase F